MKKYIEDILLISGSVAVITATFLITVVTWNCVAGLYVLGAFLLAFGVWFTKHPLK
jgi:uncharacterized membrane protein